MCGLAKQDSAEASTRSPEAVEAGHLFWTKSAVFVLFTRGFHYDTEEEGSSCDALLACFSGV